MKMFKKYDKNIKIIKGRIGKKPCNSNVKKTDNSEFIKCLVRRLEGK